MIDSLFALMDSTVREHLAALPSELDLQRGFADAVVTFRGGKRVVRVQAPANMEETLSALSKWQETRDCAAFVRPLLECRLSEPDLIDSVNRDDLFKLFIKGAFLALGPEVGGEILRRLKQPSMAARN